MHSGLVGPALLLLLRRRAGLVWNLGFAAAVLLAPLHQLARDARGLTGLGTGRVSVRVDEFVNPVAEVSSTLG